MIRNRNDLKEYLIADKRALGRERKHPGMNDYIWKYQILLRKAEFYVNTSSSLIDVLFRKYYNFRLQRMGIKCGYSISPNTCGKGLNLAHIGTIVISKAAHIGDYCRIHTGVNIGTAAGTENQAPTIGNNVYIGPGAKIFGPIIIADGVAIGANAVVNKSCSTENVTLVGVPAKIILNGGAENFIKH